MGFVSQLAHGEGTPWKFHADNFYMWQQALPRLQRRRVLAQAQAYPTRPIRLVVPFPPGGAFDALARPWADKIRPLLGTVFIDNIGGATGSSAAAVVLTFAITARDEARKLRHTPGRPALAET